MRLLVLGNAVVDHVYRVGHLPAPGETVLAGGKHVDVGGKGLNQAVVAKRAGASARLVAAIGHDHQGQLVATRVAAEGLDPDILVVTGSPTDESIVLVAPDAENVIVSTAAAAAELPQARALAEIATLAAGDLLLLQGNLSAALTMAALRRARDGGVRTMLNLAPVAFAPEPALQLADIAVMNTVEAAAVGTHAAPTMILTEGAQGARLRRGTHVTQVPAPSVQAVDTTGAGDVVCGVVAAGLVLGLAIEAALRWAVAAAALTVTRHGAFASLPSAAELQSLRP